jgi:hypothetical protein
MSIPAFAANRGTARTRDEVGTWYASQHYKDLARATQVDLPNNSSYDLGGDGVELLQLTQYGVFIFLIRRVLQ